MVEIDLTYRGELDCEAVHGPSGATLRTTAPADNQGRGDSFSPTDLVATGLGACLLTVLGIVARRHGLDPVGATAHVEKTMSDTAPRRIARLAVTLRVPLDVEPALREKCEAALRGCPVHHSLHPEIDVPIVVEWDAT